MASGGGGGSEEGVEGGMEVDVKFWKFAGEGYQSRTSANMETVGGGGGGGGVQILIILWELNNWMSPFRGKKEIVFMD